MVVNDIIKKLNELGFSNYESKAFVALSKDNPATAYEIAKNSSIPTSKIYEVLNKLLDKKVIHISEGMGKKRYTPLKIDEFIESRKYKLDKTLNELKDDFTKLDTNNEVSHIWNIYEYEELINKAERLLIKAKKSILISGWNEELKPLEHILKKKSSKDNIKTSIVHFGKINIDYGQIFQHPIEDTIYNEKGGRGIMILIDSEEALIGTVFENNKIEGAWSSNKGFVTLAEDYIKHDIYIMKIVKRFDSELIKKFGKNYKLLRDIYTDNELN